MGEADLQLGGGYTYQWECAILLALNYFFDPVRYNPTLSDLIDDFLGRVTSIHLEGEDRESGIDLEDVNLIGGKRRILIQVKSKQAEGQLWTPSDLLLRKALYRFCTSRLLTEQPENSRFVFLTNRPFNPTLVQVKLAIKEGTVGQCPEVDQLHQQLDRYAHREKKEPIDPHRFREMLARTALVEYLAVDEVKANVQAKLQAHGRLDWKQAHSLLFEHFARQSTRVGGGTVTRESIVEILGPPPEVSSEIVRRLEAHDVRGLPNPYLGLRSFTYDDQERYAGREDTVERVVELLTKPGEQRTRLFITGASGCGKSSFIQAGLLPALEAHYKQRNRTVRWAVFRPSGQPLAGLAEALLQLGLPAGGPFEAAAPYMTGEPAEVAQAGQISLLFIDQFEELFTQSKPDQRDALLTILGSLPPFAELGAHVVTTLRVDYLPDLFPHQALYDIAKQGVDLRVMGEDELREAILHPLRQAYPDGEKRFEDALLDKLTEDAAEDAAYLPLLQVTLEDLWRRGSLTLGAYGNLTDAIRKWAEEVYEYRQDADGQPVPRTEAEKKTIMETFLDLVEVSLDDDYRRDVRRRRRMDMLERNDPIRRRLIQELVSSRLLSTSMEADSAHRQDTEIVDIIHESLIANWARLKDTIADQRDILQQRARLEHAIAEWVSEDRDDVFLLDGVRLAEAETLNRMGDIALQSKEAQEILRLSIERRESSRRRQRNTLIGVIAALLVLLTAALGATWFGFDARNKESEQRATAVFEGKRSQSITLATQAQLELQGNRPERSVLLALEALERYPYTWQAERALGLAVQNNQWLRLMLEPDMFFSGLAWSPNGDRILAYGSDKDTGKEQLIMWNPETGEEALSVDWSGIGSVAWSPDGARFATGGYSVAIWDANTGEKLDDFPVQDMYFAESVSWSPDGTRLLSVGGLHGPMQAWDATTMNLLFSIPDVDSASWSPDSTRLAIVRGDYLGEIRDGLTGERLLELEGTIYEVSGMTWSPDGTRVVGSAPNDTARIWDARTGAELLMLTAHEGFVISAEWSPDGVNIITGSGDFTAKLWDSETGRNWLTLSGHTASVVGVTWSPDSTQAATASQDGMVLVWDVKPDALLTLPEHFDWVWYVAWSPDGKYVATSTGSYVKVNDSDTVTIWDSSDGTAVFTLSDYRVPVWDMSWSPDGTHIVTAGDDNQVRIWDSATGIEEVVLDTHSMWTAWSPDGQYILTDGDDNTALIWDASTQEVRMTLTGHTGVVSDGSWSPDGMCIVTISKDQTARIWDVTDGSEMMMLSNQLTVSSDGSGILNNIVWSPDGTRIVAGDADGVISVWDAATGDELLTILGHTASLSSVSWSPNSQRILTTSVDGQVKIWDATTGAELITLAGHADLIRHAAWSPDGERVATASNDRTAKVWRVWQTTQDLVDYARECCVVRSLTEQEQAQFGLLDE